MGNITPFAPEKLMMGLLFRDKEQAEDAKKTIVQTWGELDFVSDTYTFSDHSPYYDKEMGGTVFRQFISVERLIDPQALAEIKIKTNAIEATFMHAGYRPINLDPGLINTGRLILATTKSVAHRFALQSGIYGELTLFYSQKRWQILPWTYPDFRDATTQADLSQIRKLYRKQIREH
ncbi:DUF4416 family protein [Entomospira culicis]|uniref:DUF4416 family protein n=1 Tax=Entomospira culicis TaxID=2719989 RepID=A0A968GJQ4_9SPIO|nr:DUF4416 family protein [Entomospira culicis]NIZ19731.1 DUF4416 family protein [Entomospira culicis]NIZ69945.1 DUF4416 family protein [Entomospira culicis]WDI37050.1 DUF4416 family protein [Entomospira culicis]WDI38679.1 DUF4416 family protein [Entomospira culicis]